jgi:hypothetical protein
MIAYVILLRFSLKLKREIKVTEVPLVLGFLAHRVLLAPQVQ